MQQKVLPDEIEKQQLEQHRNDMLTIKSWIDLTNLIRKRAPDQARNLTKEFRDHLKLKNYIEPAPIQKMVLPYLLLQKTEERFVYIKSPTGTGKTLSFILPLLFFFEDDYLQNFYKDEQGKLQYYPYALILVAQHPLLRQIRDDFEGATPTELKNKGFKVQHFDKGNNENNIEGHVLCGIPETILRQVQKGKINLKNLRYIVVDEADNTAINDKTFKIAQIITKLIDTGNPSYKLIMCGATINKRELEHYFTENIRPRTKLPDLYFNFKYFNYMIELDNIYHYYYDKPKTKEEMLQFLINIIQHALTRIIEAQIMVFFNQKVVCNEVTKLIYGIPELAFLVEQQKICEIRANSKDEEEVPREEQQKIIEEFRNGGMNFRKVRLVINYGVPRMSQFGAIDYRRYDQRVGRTGRMEDLGVALTIFNPEIPQSADIPAESGMLKEFKDNNCDIKIFDHEPFFSKMEEVYEVTNNMEQKKKENKQIKQQ